MSKRKPARRAWQRVPARRTAVAGDATRLNWSWHRVLVVLILLSAAALIVVRETETAYAWWFEDESYRSEPEEAVVTSRYYPHDDTELHVRQYNRCNRFNDCRLSGYEVRFLGKRRSIGRAGLTGRISDHFTLDRHRLWVEVNGRDVYVYDTSRTGIKGSGFHKVLTRMPHERWLEVSVAERLLAIKPPSKPRYLIAGTRLFDQQTLKQVGTIPEFRPTYYDGTNLYFLQKVGPMLRLHALTLPSLAPELLDEIPVDCLNDSGARLLLNAEEISRYEGLNNAMHPVLFHPASLNSTRASLAFQKMSAMPRTSERITFYSLRGADFVDRHKRHCSAFAFKGAASFEQMNIFSDVRMQQNQRMRESGGADR